MGALVLVVVPSQQCARAVLPFALLDAPVVQASRQGLVQAVQLLELECVLASRVVAHQDGPASAELVPELAEVVCEDVYVSNDTPRNEFKLNIP